MGTDHFHFASPLSFPHRGSVSLQNSPLEKPRVCSFGFPSRPRRSIGFCSRIRVSRLRRSGEKLLILPMDSINPSACESVEKAVQRNFDEVIRKDDSARLVLMAKGSDGGDQETLDPGAATRLLQLACRLGAVKCARVLIEGKVGTAVHINEMNQTGRTPLHLAAEMHSTKCIELLIEKNARTDLKSKDGNGLLALEIALSSERMQVDWSHNNTAKSLLDLVEKKDLRSIRSLAAATEDVGRVSLNVAMKGQIAKLAALLLVDVDKVTAPLVVPGPTGSKNNRTTVYQAVLEETLRLGQIKKTAAAETKVIGGDSSENCYVMRRILLREIELLQLFGVRIFHDCKSKRVVPLLARASKAGDEAVAKLLLKADVVEKKKKADGNMGLHRCLRTGGTSEDPWINFFRDLPLEEDLSLDWDDRYEGPMTAARLLKSACTVNAAWCARALIQGRMGTIDDNEMDLSLQIAAEMHCSECIELLIQNDARTNLKSMDGNGLLEIALSSKRMLVHWSHTDSVKDLVTLLEKKCCKVASRCNRGYCTCSLQ